MSSRSASRVETVIRLAKVVEIVLDGVGLTPNQYRMLTFVAAGAPPLRELAVRLVMKPPNVTALVDGLVARKLVRRHRGEADRRRMVLSLTDAGQQLLATAEAQCAASLQRVATAGGPGARDRLSGLDRWVPALDAVAGQLARGELMPGV